MAKWSANSQLPRLERGASAFEIYERTRRVCGQSNLLATFAHSAMREVAEEADEAREGRRRSSIAEILKDVDSRVIPAQMAADRNDKKLPSSFKLLERTIQLMDSNVTGASGAAPQNQSSNAPDKSQLERAWLKRRSDGRAIVLAVRVRLWACARRSVCAGVLSSLACTSVPHTGPVPSAGRALGDVFLHALGPQGRETECCWCGCMRAWNRRHAAVLAKQTQCEPRAASE